MKTFFDNLMILINEFQSYIYIFIIVAALGIGLTLILSEEGTEKLKKRAPLIIVGVVFTLSATALGAYYGAGLKY